MTLTTCPGCNLTHPGRNLAEVSGLLASPECRAESAEVLAAFYTPPLVGVRQYVVDAYACTHPDTTTTRGIQTTALCLMTLDLYLECAQPVSDGSIMHQEMMRAGATGFHVLDGPAPGSCPTHHVFSDSPPTEYAHAARTWAAAVWAAWQPHHGQVREWNLRWVPHRVR